jgi:nitroreductase
MTSASVVLRNAVEAAVMAPSSHNTQPWRFRIRGDTLDILADRERQLRIIDREGRQLLESCGCALYNARVAIHAMGFDYHVTYVGDWEHIASIDVTNRRSATEIDHAQMAAIGMRATNRRAFLARPVAPVETDALTALAHEEGVTALRLVPAQKLTIAKLVEVADNEQFADPDFRNELTRWLVPRGLYRRDGIPFVEKEYGSDRPFGVGRTLRSPAIGEIVGLLEEALVRGAPAVMALGTRTDDGPAWLACGQALEAILLRVTSRGLAAAFLNQVLEIPDLRARIANLLPEIGFPQMLLRIGVPSEPNERLAPRRKVDEVLEMAG